MASKSPSVVDLELVDEEVGGRGDSVHRLQADIPCGAAISEQSVRLAATQCGAQVDAVRAFHAPGEDVVGACPSDGEDGIGVHPQGLVDADGEQHHQVAHPGRIVDAVAVDGVGHDESFGRRQALQQVGPGRSQVGVVSDRAAARQRRFRDRERQPCHGVVPVGHANSVSVDVVAAENVVFSKSGLTITSGDVGCQRSRCASPVRR